MKIFDVIILKTRYCSYKKNIFYKKIKLIIKENEAKQIISHYYHEIIYNKITLISVEEIVVWKIYVCHEKVMCNFKYVYVFLIFINYFTFVCELKEKFCLIFFRYKFFSTEKKHIN